MALLCERERERESHYAQYQGPEIISLSAFPTTTCQNVLCEEKAYWYHIAPLFPGNVLRGY